jgi:hypothetical protein
MDKGERANGLEFLEEILETNLRIWVSSTCNCMETPTEDNHITGMNDLEDGKASWDYWCARSLCALLLSD